MDGFLIESFFPISNNFVVKKSIISIVGCFFLSIAFSLYVKAQAVSNPKKGNTGSRQLLGTAQAKFCADYDVIYMNGTYDFFIKIKIRVTDAPLNIARMVVRYDDGGAPENVDTL
jgi:hypothetical protein